jgi:hypothetical protein
MGLLDNLFGASTSSPAPKQIGLDAGTQGLIQSSIAEANRPTSSFASEMNSGAQGALNRLAPTDAVNDFGKTGTTTGFRDAIRGAYAGQAGQALEHIKTTNDLMAEQRKANALKQASQNVMQQANMNTNYYQTLTDSYNQMEAQRSAFISSISGLANYAAGTYIGSKNKAASPGISPDQNVAQSSAETFLPGRQRLMAPVSSYDY